MSKGPRPSAGFSERPRTKLHIDFLVLIALPSLYISLGVDCLSWSPSWEIREPGLKHTVSAAHPSGDKIHCGSLCGQGFIGRPGHHVKAWYFQEGRN